MKVAVWPADEGGCGAYRCVWPAQALIAQGADVDLRLPGEGSGMHGTFVDETDPATGITVTRLVQIDAPPDVDVVVLQRPLMSWRADMVPLLQAEGIRVVVEIDDDFATIHRRNTSWRSTHSRFSPARNWTHLARACADADLVTVTTPVLAERYGRHGRVAVVPNHIPARYLDIAPDLHDRPLTIAWTGSIDTHPTDLQVTGGAIQRAIRVLDARMAVVGTGKGVRDGLRLVEEPDACGWVDLDVYPEHMAQAHIGIVPLDAIPFNHAKSWLKMLEYAALGVPVIASPTDDNVRLHARGVGALAPDPKGWDRHLHQMADPELRAEMADAGRQVAAMLTIEGNTDRWWDAWSSSLNQKAAA